MRRENRNTLIQAASLLLLALMVWSAGKTHAVFFVRDAAADAGASILQQENRDRRRICLSFDDGPDPRYTPQLLDGLAKRGVKASFFLTGKNAEKYPDLVKRLHEEGHLIGNHTYSHMQLTRNNRESFKQELIRTNRIIEEITGEEVVYVRPPYGCWDKSFEEELNMFPVLWNIDPLDWSCKDASNIVKRVVSRAKDNAIILMHDEYPSTVTAALQIVDRLQEEGYEFVTVEEILFE